jgi:hypothetical protein
MDSFHTGTHSNLTSNLNPQLPSTVTRLSENIMPEESENLSNERFQVEWDDLSASQ